MTNLNHLYKYDNVVVGSGLNALMFAYLKQYPLIINADKPPMPFEFFDVDFNLGQFGFEPCSYQLKTGDGIKVVGLSKLEVWQRLFFTLSIAGLCPLALKTKSIRVSENKLKIATHRSRLIKCEFNKLFVFDNENIRGLSFLLEDKIKEYKVIDWFNVRRGNKHEIDYISTDGDFVNEIYFYKAHKRNAKDLAAVSYMSFENLRAVEYTDTFVKFKVLELMKENGIRGPRNGRDVWNPEKYCYYLPRIEYEKREVLPIYKFDEIEEKNTIFITETEEEISKKYKLEFPIDNSYLYKTAERLSGEIYLH